MPLSCFGASSLLPEVSDDFPLPSCCSTEDEPCCPSLLFPPAPSLLDCGIPGRGSGGACPCCGGGGINFANKEAIEFISLWISFFASCSCLLGALYSGFAPWGVSLVNFWSVPCCVCGCLSDGDLPAVLLSLSSASPFLSSSFSLFSSWADRVSVGTAARGVCNRSYSGTLSNLCAFDSL